jgi:hypothetical protein
MSIGPVAKTFLTCVLLGPPVGGIVLSLLLTVIGPEKIGVLQALGAALLIMPFSYLSGGLSALVSGIIMAAYGYYRGRPPLVLALVVACAVFVVLQSVQNDQNLSAAVSLFLAHIISAAVCWFVFRRFWEPVQ